MHKSIFQAIGKSDVLNAMTLAIADKTNRLKTIGKSDVLNAMELRAILGK